MTVTVTTSRSELATRYRDVRGLTETLAAPLSPEDQTVQSMPDVSPTKWHRAHTSWFFETFVLGPYSPRYEAFHPQFAYLFNSYYEGVGPRHPRPQRGLLSRPGVGEITAYRDHVDAGMRIVLDAPLDERAAFLVDLGLHHEQQHQELLLMDIKHVLSCNPLAPAYRPDVGAGTGPASAHAPATAATAAAPSAWVDHPGGLVDIGHAGGGFAFDNESPRHTVLLRPFRLATRPVTNGEWLEFMADGGYARPELWLSDGWATVLAEQWDAPLYWRHRDGADHEWDEFTLTGQRVLDPAQPVCHVSYYEADAFARWRGARLATETEWEAVAAEHTVESGRRGLDALHPQPARDATGPLQLLGEAWEWTASPYVAYPGFRPAAGAVGEYNGKFMVNQHVLRGGCCLTPPGHVRVTYRNFFPPSARWACSGVRLAADD